MVKVKLLVKLLVTLLVTLLVMVLVMVMEMLMLMVLEMLMLMMRRWPGQPVLPSHWQSHRMLRLPYGSTLATRRCGAP